MPNCYLKIGLEPGGGTVWHCAAFSWWAWNHPCFVIWLFQNYCNSVVTGSTIPFHVLPLPPSDGH